MISDTRMMSEDASHPQVTAQDPAGTAVRTERVNP